MKFKYQAKNKAGDLQVGYVDAVNRKLATSILTKHGLFVLSIESQRKNSIRDRILYFANRVRSKDLMLFTRQLSTLIESEMPLDDALQALYKQTKNKTLKETTFNIIKDIESGLSLSQALERSSPIFSDFYINMVRSAEVTGRLEEAMSFLADYIERDGKWRAKIINALIYPAILFGVFVVVAGIMVAIVFPKLAPVFGGAGVKLPFFTQILMSFGNILTHWWLVVALVMVGLSFIIVDYFKSSEGKVVASEIILVSPVFGKLFKKIYIARFARSFSVLIKGGIPMTQAIEIAADTMGNKIYKDVLSSIAQGVREGAMFSHLLSDETKYFPVIVGQMAAIGETTGRLEQMMTKIAEFYDGEVGDMIANLGELIQPILILVIGLMVGLLFASILLPIYNLAGSFRV